MPTTLVDLPTEILDIILLDPAFATCPEALFHTSRVCRRLHFIALPAFLAVSGLTLDSASFVPEAQLRLRTDHVPDLFAGLETALFPIRIETIRCVLPHPSCITIQPLVACIRRLTHWIASPSLAGVVSFILEPDRHGSQCLSVGNDEQLGIWVDAMQSLLNVVVIRGCVDLTVSFGSQLTKTHIYSPKPSSSWIKALGAKLWPGKQSFSRSVTGSRAGDLTVDALFRRDAHWGIRRFDMILAPSISAAAGGVKISTVRVASAILITPPGLRWTLSLLQTGHITTLGLDFDVADEGLWSHVLPVLKDSLQQGSHKGNQLRKLELRNTKHHLNSIVLALLPSAPMNSLIELAIYDELTWELRAPNAVSLTFPLVESLKAPVPYITFMLRQKALPALRDLCILWRMPTTSLAFPSPQEIADILSEPLSLLDSQHLTPCLSVILNAEVYLYELDQPSAPILPSPLQPSKILSRIQRVEIFVKRYHFDNISDVVRWVTPFPAVKRLELCISGAGVYDYSDVARRARKDCATLTEIVINGRLF
uniref:F-box domain-containing protein n=1 Tax=Mycena chlorophos TaxID=658473 RepID=A0ABQ0LV75_MYCCL|nr:predicted protein [Mycena chlorophos]